MLINLHLTGSLCIASLIASFAVSVSYISSSLFKKRILEAGNHQLNRVAKLRRLIEAKEFPLKKPVKKGSKSQKSNSTSKQLLFTRLSHYLAGDQ